MRETDLKYLQGPATWSAVALLACLLLLLTGPRTGLGRNVEYSPPHLVKGVLWGMWQVTTQPASPPPSSTCSSGQAAVSLVNLQWGVWRPRPVFPPVHRYLLDVLVDQLNGLACADSCTVRVPRDGQVRLLLAVRSLGDVLGYSGIEASRDLLLLRRTMALFHCDFLHLPELVILTNPLLPLCLANHEEVSAGPGPGPALALHVGPGQGCMAILVFLDQ